MSRKRIGRHIEGGSLPDDERERRQEVDALRDAFARWATGVTIVAVRDEDDVHALTVSAFMPVSVDPALVLIGLGPNAAARPYLRPGTRIAVSVLHAEQRGLASRFADTFPAGTSPFAPQGPPVVEGCSVALVCEVEELLARGDHELVVARVIEARTGREGPALVYFRRDYHEVGDPDE